MLNEHLKWPGVKQVCRLERTTFRNGKTTRDMAYAITSASRAKADAARLLEWWRSHWGIENKEHYVRDETFGEDRSRVRTGAAPQVMAAVRNLVTNWLRAHKTVNIAQALRENGWNPQRLFAMLGKENQ